MNGGDYGGSLEKQGGRDGEDRKPAHIGEDAGRRGADFRGNRR